MHLKKKLKYIKTDIFIHWWKKVTYLEAIFKRPCVAGAVLQTPLSLSEGVSLLLQIFNKPSFPSL